MKTIKVSIKGISPLLMHRFDVSDAASGGPVKVPDSAEEAAEKAAYRLPDGMLYVPAENVRAALVAAAVYEKGRGRASLQKYAAAAIFVSPQALELGTDKYEIDARPVVVPATRGRVIRYRPRLDKWGLTFYLEYDDELLTEEQVRRIVDHCGSKVGLLDFRPQKKGPFGRFMVERWEVLEG